MKAPQLQQARLAAIVALFFLAVLPFGIESAYIRHLIVLSFIYAIVASNWDLTLGYTGIFNFAHLAFFGLGAYAAAVLSKGLGLSPWLGLPAGAGIAMIAAAAVSIPVLRLKGIYVVLVTFAFGQLCLQVILSQSAVTGGTQGMVGLPPLRIGSMNLARDGALGYYYIGLGLLTASTLFLRSLVSSHFGLSLIALRDDEDYAASRGVSVARQRLLAMVTSAAFTGAAGAFYALFLRVASPDVFDFSIVALVLSMLVVGGAGTIWGPIIGAFALTFLTEAMVGIGPWRFIIVALAMIVVIRAAPGGIASLGSIGRKHLRAREL